MPDLSDDLRSYFDELAHRAEQVLDVPPVDDGAFVPVAPRRSSRASVLVRLLVGLAVLLAVSGVVMASRRSSDEPLRVGGSTTIATASPTRGTLEVSIVPASGLVDGTTVVVHATGLAPGQTAAVVTCAGAFADPGRGSAGCDLGTLQYAPARSDGVVDAVYRVRRVIRVGGAYDCGTRSDGCRIAVGPTIQPPDGTMAGGSFPLGFAPGPAAPLPTISMSPDAGLRDGQTVMVTGDHFSPDVDVTVTECPPDTDCGYEPFGVTAHTDGTGRFQQPLTLHRTFLVPANLPGGVTAQQLDCTAGCTVNAVESGPASNLSADPLPFTLSS